MHISADAYACRTYMLATALSPHFQSQSLLPYLSLEEQPLFTDTKAVSLALTSETVRLNFTSADTDARRQADRRRLDRIAQLRDIQVNNGNKRLAEGRLRRQRVAEYLGQRSN